MQLVQPFKRVERRLAGSRVPRTTAANSKRMGRVRQHGTSPELAARRIASSVGLRYLLCNSDLPRRPDLANRSRRIAVFVHGCFWHRHPHCPRSTVPKSNVAYWNETVLRNVARDRRGIATLRRRGFTVVVIWECELSVTACVARRLERVAFDSGR